MTAAPVDLRRDEPLRGIAAMLAAVVFFKIMDALVKAMGQEGLSVAQLANARAAFALIPVIAIAQAEGGVRLFRSRRPWGHALRGGLGCMGLFCVFYALIVLELVQAIALWFAMPLFLTALSVPLLGEKVGVHRWLAVLVGLIGVGLILRPGAEIVQAGALVMLAGAFVSALTMVQVRRLASTEATVAIVFWFSVFTMTASALAMLGWAAFGDDDPAMARLLAWTTPPDLRTWALLAAMGIAGGVAQYFMTMAYRFASPSVVGPFEYTAILGALAVGYLIFDEVPTPLTLAGAGIVIGAGLYIVHRETVRRRALTAAPKPAAR